MLFLNVYISSIFFRPYLWPLPLPPPPSRFILPISFRLSSLLETIFVALSHLSYKPLFEYTYIYMYYVIISEITMCISQSIPTFLIISLAPSLLPSFPPPFPPSLLNEHPITRFLRPSHTLPLLVSHLGPALFSLPFFGGGQVTPVGVFVGTHHHHLPLSLYTLHLPFVHHPALKFSRFVLTLTFLSLPPLPSRNASGMTKCVWVCACERECIYMFMYIHLCICVLGWCVLSLHHNRGDHSSTPLPLSLPPSFAVLLVGQI